MAGLGHFELEIFGLQERSLARIGWIGGAFSGSIWRTGDPRLRGDLVGVPWAFGEFP